MKKCLILLICLLSSSCQREETPADVFVSVGDSLGKRFELDDDARDQLNKQSLEPKELNDAIFTLSVMLGLSPKRTELNTYKFSVVKTAAEGRRETSETGLQGQVKYKSFDQIRELPEIVRSEKNTEVGRPSDYRVVPYFRNGEVLGLRVFALSEDSALFKFGVRNGDIITKIDGVEVDYSNEDEALIRNLSRDEKTVVQLETAGVEWALDTSIEENKRPNLQNEIGPEVSKRVSVSDEPLGIESEVGNFQTQKSLKNSSQMHPQARAVPYFRDGTIVGVRFFAIAKGSLYEKVGLLNGDILKTIDGRNVQDVSDVFQVFELLSAGEGFEVEVERKGKVKVVRAN